MVFSNLEVSFNDVWVLGFSIEPRNCIRFARMVDLCVEDAQVEARIALSFIY